MKFLIKPSCSYKIGDFFVEEYHQRLRAMFSEFAQQADDLSTQEILVLGSSFPSVMFLFFCEIQKTICLEW